MKTRNVRRKQRLRYARSYGVVRYIDRAETIGLVYGLRGEWPSMPDSVLDDVWFS